MPSKADLDALQDCLEDVRTFSRERLLHGSDTEFWEEFEYYLDGTFEQLFFKEGTTWELLEDLVDYDFTGPDGVLDVLDALESGQVPIYSNSLTNEQLASWLLEHNMLNRRGNLCIPTGTRLRLLKRAGYCDGGNTWQLQDADVRLMYSLSGFTGALRKFITKAQVLELLTAVGEGLEL